jgi:hypothetical protein
MRWRMEDEEKDLLEGEEGEGAAPPSNGTDAEGVSETAAASTLSLLPSKKISSFTLQFVVSCDGMATAAISFSRRVSASRVPLMRMSERT